MVFLFNKIDEKYTNFDDTNYNSKATLTILFIQVLYQSIITTNMIPQVKADPVDELVIKLKNDNDVLKKRDSKH